MIRLKKYFCCDGVRADGAYETLQLTTTNEVLAHLPVYDGYLYPQELGEILMMEVLHPDHARYEMHLTIIFIVEGPYPEVESVVNTLKSRRKR
jgi:hypothetical protein